LPEEVRTKSKKGRPERVGKGKGKKEENKDRRKIRKR
jgi:hypothetical protein